MALNRMDAAMVGVTPTGAVAATNLQSAITEIDSEKQTTLSVISQVDIEAGTSTTPGLMTPQRIKQAITAQAPSVVQGVPTGTVLEYVGSTEPAGWLFLSGRTIGNASSGGTGRANADTSALFELLWNSMANTEAAVSSGRGGSAAADFAANKTIALPDARGRVIAGKDNMGGTTASRLTSASGITGTTLGVAGGTQTHTLTAGESGMPSHGHSLSGGSVFSFSGGDAGVTTGAGLFTAGSISGAGPYSASSAHNNTQPTLVLNKIIKL